MGEKMIRDGQFYVLEIDGGWLISTGRFWVPGIYETAELAKHVTETYTWAKIIQLWKDKSKTDDPVIRAIDIAGATDADRRALTPPDDLSARLKAEGGAE